MKALLNFTALLFCSILIYQENIDTLKVKTNWKTNGNAIFLINQSSFSNWTSGGQSSVSGTLKINYNLNYFDNGWAWDTKIPVSYTHLTLPTKA